jgi:hypothetical protein
MHIHCHLGRIAPVELAPSAILQGTQNARKWVIDLTCSGAERTQIAIKLVDWRSGVQTIDRATGRPALRGVLLPQAVAMNQAAARAQVFFPAAADGNLVVVVEPVYVLGEGEAQLRLVVDAHNTLVS